MRIPLAAAAVAAAISLSSCAYNGLSMGYGNYGYDNGYYDPYYGGYSPYGYRSVGYGGYGGYGGFGSYGYGYGSPFGWYDGFYYPGTGYYVYDRYRRPHVWSDRQRQYWVRLKPRSTSGSATTTAAVSPNWTGFTRDRQPVTRPARVDRTSTQKADREARVERRSQAREDRDDTRPRRRRADQ